MKYINNLEINSIYDFDNAFSINELLCKFWEKIEETIKISNESIDILNWIKEQGLPDELQVLLNQLVADGTIEQMINVDKIEELRTLINSEITNVNEQLDTKATEVDLEVERKRIDSQITNVNEQLDTKATKVELEVERKRIDSLTKLGEGSTTGDAELIDGRINFDGWVYDNIGSSIRSVGEYLNIITGESLFYSYHWFIGGYINNTNGELIANDSWKYTDFIQIVDINKFYINTTQNGSTSYNAFYDENKNFICNFSVNVESVTVPTNAKYFRLSVATNYNTLIIKNIESLNSKCNNKDVLSISNNLVNTIIDEYIGVKKEYNYTWNDGGYIDNSNGKLVTYANWKYTDFVQIPLDIKKLNIETGLDGSYSYNAFYDKNKNFICSFSVNVDSVTIPTNAKYFRLSVTSNTQTVITNNIEKLIEKCTLEDVKELIGGSGATDIITLNKDVEPFVIQASEGLGQMFTNKTKPLVFTHFSDVHTMQELWNRIIDYNNYYSDYLKFSIHTGDYCGGNRLSYNDLYANGNPCDIPVFNCVGNHDTYLSNNSKGDKKTTHDLLFNHTTNWNVTFMDIANSMTYYKDFTSEKIRFIVLDYYYDIDAQCTWLLEQLNGAKALGFHVITCMHEMTNVITNKLDTPFQTIDNFESLGGNKHSISKFDKVIGNWIKGGGVHVANFAGHEHSDFIGYTDNGVLNICVQSATDNIIWTDGKRVKGTRTWDCFNVVSVDVATNNLKLIRVGNNSDHYLREKKVFSYDYISRKILSN